MNIRLLSAIILGLSLSAAASAQDSTTPQQQGQGQGQGGGGQRGGGGRGFGGGMGMGRGAMGTVTEITPDHFTIKTETGDVYAVHYSVNTRILKQQPRPAAAESGDRGEGFRGAPPMAIKATDIHIGDVIGAMGELDPTTKSVGATLVMQIDPERAKQMREMQANYGKTWIMGKVTAIDGVKVTLMGSVDNAAHTFVADEDTTFRKRRDPITLADIQIGDTVRVEGGLKDGAFIAKSVNAMGAPQGGGPSAPRNGPPTASPQ